MLIHKNNPCFTTNKDNQEENLLPITSILNHQDHILSLESFFKLYIKIFPHQLPLLV